ncbi:MAG: PhzF family phenazine biosynthesis protein [Fimbriimonadaceae bacterium]|nr:PhzF family phenazine biosynthesis protein [Fimbriimonadaceae bacterium]
MSVPFFLVDAFADEPFTGNPAGVVLVDGDGDDRWMAAFAAEVNQAETAFVELQDEGFGLRWFTPTVEVDLCGHATLAAAHVLYEVGRTKADQPIHFSTRSGDLSARRTRNGIELDFPAERAWPCAPPEGLTPLVPDPVWVGRNRFDWFVELKDEASVRSFAPDMAGIADLGLRGLILTAKSETNQRDFVSRFFAPQSGVPEDAVTGSAHCCLGPYWSDRLRKANVIGYQASARGGTVAVEVRGDRVGLFGEARIVVRGWAQR